MIKDTIKHVMMRNHLSQAEASSVLSEIIDSDVTDGQISALLVALAMKGETVDELAGFAAVMRERAAYFPTKHKLYVDTSGTGGDSKGTFNISTTAAFVIAGAGVPVAKHGNRAVSSLSGSADILTELGVQITLSPELAGKCLDEIGICFMFAPAFHIATKRVAEIRRQLGVRTAFNLLGPLTNPAKTPRQLVGVFSHQGMEKCAHVLAQLGTERSWVVWGSDGLDEITLSGTTYVAEVQTGKVKFFELLPKDFGLPTITTQAISGTTAKENAQTLREILSNKGSEEIRSVVLANSAAVLYLCDKAKSLKEAVELAQNSISQGKALEKLEQLIQLSNSSSK
ncbi:MAG: anthranilate phosphoribosyltransferase [Acidobacteria bacterium]|nr:anthranilate phosphoribosyltransferase [Acidobacteriota bacterium]